jgi:cytochrome c oxidase subunit 2
VVLLLLTSCSTAAPSTLNPKGPGASRIAALWWFMFAVSAAVIVLVTVLIFAGVLPRRRRRSDPGQTPRWANGMILVGGLLFPIAVLSILWVWVLRDMSALSSPARGQTLQIDVVGHQWFWEVRYPKEGFATANDIHIPVGEPVRLRLTTVDVLHSFWVPQLTGKTDLISGRVNNMTIQADHPGVYRGQCAEFCGLQHANMIFYVIAQPRAQFDSWIEAESSPPATPTDPVAAAGREVFLNEPCVACHVIRGTSEHVAPGSALSGMGLGPTTAVEGPDLTDFGSRLSIGAGTVPNTRGNLGGWIVDSQSIKPGNYMPPIPVGAKELQELIAYLESLKG